jgi:hypothetical protein
VDGADERLRANSACRTPAALATVLVAVGVTAASGANFNAQSANPSNTFTAGTLSMLNSKAGAAILTASNMRPGDPATTGDVDIKNTGSLAGTFSLSKSNIADSDTGNPLSGKLTVVVGDCGAFVGATAPSCASPTQKYSGTISGMGTVALGSFAAGEQHRYQFSVSFPDGGAAGADNAYQGDNTSVEYDWNAVS